ncbi:corrinoid protein [Bacillota bacterium LX-D]|nr:corrinoid protein [Bacillota bacterium LX-D]
MKLVNEMEQIANGVVEGNATLVKTLAEKLLAIGEAPEKILHDGLVAGMNIVSEKFRDEKFYVPDVLIASRAAHAGMRVLKPYLRHESANNGKVVIGTVAGDLHDIGKNMVVMLLRSQGYKVIDLGIDVHPEEFVEAVENYEPQVLGMSALLTTTMPTMLETIKLLEKTGLRKKVKVVIGGGPVTRDFQEAINADGYGVDAWSAVETVTKCVKSLSEKQK